MIVSPKLAARVLKGDPAHVRLKARDDDRPVFPAGHLAVQTMRAETDPPTGERVRRRATICHAEIAASWTQELHEITDRDAQAEGFKSRDELLDWWLERHRQGCGRPGNPEYPIRVVTHVAALRLVETRRFLAPTPPDIRHRPSDERGYGNTPAGWLRDEPEAVDEDTLARFAMESGQDNVARIARYESQIRERPLYEQLEAVLNEAKRSGVDLGRQERELRGRIEAMRRKVRKRAA